MDDKKYIVKPGGIIEAVEWQEWAAWYEAARDKPFVEGGRRVARTAVNDVDVSTVFLSDDHNWSGAGAPVLFETMIFGGEHDQFQERYCTVEEALAGHTEAVRLAMGADEPIHVGSQQP